MENLIKAEIDNLALKTPSETKHNKRQKNIILSSTYIREKLIVWNTCTTKICIDTLLTGLYYPHTWITYNYNKSTNKAYLFLSFLHFSTSVLDSSCQIFFARPESCC